jgi:hypothetical protein
MKYLINHVLLVFVLVLCSFSTKEHNFSNDFQHRKIEHHAFQAGEKIEYRLHYGLINAGTIKLEVAHTTAKNNGREMLHIIGTGTTNSTFDHMYKVRDRYESYIDAEGIYPYTFIRNVDEGGYKINQQYKFNPQSKNVSTHEGKNFETPDYVQDMLSSFYYARTIDFSKAKVGDIFTITSFVDDKVWPLKIKYAGKEVIKTGGLKYNTIVFHPVIQTGRMFKHEEDVTVWISDDANKIPLVAQAKIWVGSVKMEITGYEGLANPIAQIK